MSSTSALEPTVGSVSRWLNGVALFWLSIGSVLIGMAPTLIVARRPSLAVLSALLTGALGIGYLIRNFHKLSDRMPPLRRLVLAFIAAIYPPTLLGLLMLLLYWTLWWLLRGLTAGAGLLGWDIGLNPGPSAYYTSVVLGFIMALPLLLLTVQKVAEGLQPAPSADHAGRPTKDARRAALSTLFLAAVVVAFALWEGLTDGPTTAFYVLLGLASLVASSTAFGISAAVAAPDTDLEDSTVVASLFERAGFVVERFADRESASGQRLFTGLDLLATKGTRQIAVEIKTGHGRRTPVNWEAVAALGMARWTLARERQISPAAIDPLLVLVDTRGDDTLEDAGRVEGVRVVQLSHDDLERVGPAGAGKQRREETERRLIVTLTGETAD